VWLGDVENVVGAVGAEALDAGGEGGADPHAGEQR